MAGHAGRVDAPWDIDDDAALARCRALLDSFGDGRYRLDASGRLVAVDDDLTSLTGRSREALLGRDAATLLDDDDVATAESTIEAMLANDLETATLEVDLQGADGETVPCRVRLSPLREDGEFRGTVGVVSALHDGSGFSPGTGTRPPERELDAVFERVDDAFYALDEAFRFTYVNDRAAELLDATEAELLGETVWEAFPAAAGTEIRDRFQEALATQEQVEFERYSESLGLWLAATVYPSESGLSVYFRDVTERKQRERALEESERRYRALAEHFPNGVVTLFDRDRRYTLAAGRGFERLDVEPADLEGRRIEEVWEVEPAVELEALADAVLDGNERSAEIAYGGREWVVHGVPVTDDDGEVFAGMGMAQDITDRNRLREQLRRHNDTLQRLYEISAAGDRPFDDRVRDVLELGRTYLGLDVGFLAAIDRADGGFEVRHSVGDDERFDPGSTVPLSETYCRRTIDEEGLLCVNDAPADGWTDDDAYERWALDAYVGGTVTVDGEPFGTLCFVADGPRDAAFTAAEKRFVELATQWVSYELERGRRERDLREYREYTDELLDAVDDVFYTLDAAGDVRRWNESLRAVTGYDDDEIDSMNALEFFDAAHHDAIAEALEEILETGSTRVEAPFRTREGETIPYEFVASRLEAPDGTPRVTGIGRDISERRAHEAELQRRQRQQRGVATLGQFALETDDIGELTERATTLVAETLETDYAGLLELDADAGELELRHVVGADPDLVGRRVPADGGSQSGYTLGTDDPVVVPDLDAETRFDPPALLTGGDVASGLSTVVGSAADPWGVLTAHDTERREFSEEDVDFLQSVANVLATAIDRRDRERRLEEQRERLGAINSLHEVIHGITDAVIERSTREEIEQAVCERLAESDSYRFAWVGDVDTASQTVTPRARAGTDGYLDEVEITIDPDDPRSNGPAGRAYLTGEVQTSQQVLTDPRFKPWREQAEAYDFRSSATIPIVHEDTVFGVLNVYAERPYAFADEEREIIEQVGEVVGHAIAAVERKRALMSDEVLEVEFRVRDVFEGLGVPEAEGRIAFDRAVPVDDGEHVLYGRVDPGARATLEAVVDRHDLWQSIEIRDDGDDEEEWRFELHTTGVPLVENVADQGGVVETAVVEDGDLNATIHLPRGTDVREAIAEVESRHGDVELLARRQVARSTDSVRGTTQALTETFTDRQRTALETAYHAGYFDWPRSSSGEELAEQLGISPATFTQHLRTAERKLLDALFEELPASG